MALVLLETARNKPTWFKDLFVAGAKTSPWDLYPYQRKILDSLLAEPMDSIRLALPWGEERNFLVPAGDPRNPCFDWMARGIKVERVGVTAEGVPWIEDVSVRFLCERRNDDC